MPFDSVNNYAPKQVLEDRKFADNGQAKNERASLAEVIKEIYDTYKNEFLSERLQVARTAELYFDMLDGKVVLDNSPITNRPVFSKAVKKRKNHFHTQALSLKNSQEFTSYYSNAKPRVTALLNGSGMEYELKHNSAEHIVQSYLKQFFNVPKEQEEAKYLEAIGTTVHHVFFDESLNTEFSFKPVMKEKIQTIDEGGQTCFDCGYHTRKQSEFDKGVFPQCPKCQSVNVSEFTEPTTAQSMEIVDVEMQMQGDINHETFLFTSTMFDLSGFAQDSPYFFWKDYVNRDFAENIIGIRIPSGNTEDFDLSLGDKLSASASNFFGGIGSY